MIVYLLHGFVAQFKKKDGKNQRTVLSDEEIKKIEDTFINHEQVDDFSVVVSYDEIAEKNYSFSAGQYFEVKIEYVELTQDEFENKINQFQSNLKKLFNQSVQLQEQIDEQIKQVKYERN